MKSRAVCMISILVITVVTWAMWPRGYAELLITDFTMPASLSAQAPWLPFRQGSMYVVIEGPIDGKGKILVYENSSTEPETIPIFGPKVYYISGGAENWSDSVRVTFIPETIKSGRLSIRLYCGAYPKPINRNTEQGGAANLAPLGG
jgi:hypothetical protein